MGVLFLIPRRQGGGNTRIALVGNAADQADAWGRVPVQRELRLLQGLLLGQLSARSLLRDTTLTGISRAATTVATLLSQWHRDCKSTRSLILHPSTFPVLTCTACPWHIMYSERRSAAADQRQQDHLDLYGSGPAPRAAPERPPPTSDSDGESEDDSEF